MAASPITEIFLPNDPIPVGTRQGDLIHGLRITGAPGATIEQQMAQAFENLEAAVQAAGADMDSVAQVSIFVKQRDHLQAINPVWLQHFPNDHDRPTYKFMVADLPGDQLVQLEFFALAGHHRCMVQIPNVAHTNPIPMGVRIGDMLFSSRVLPYDPATGRPGEGPEQQARHLFQNARTLIELGGLKPEDITQARLFLADLAYRGIAEPHWRALTAGAPVPPTLHVTHYGQGSPLLLMLETIAVAAPPIP